MATDEARVAASAHERAHAAQLTNMKRTLLRSLPAFDALMSWYPLRDTVTPVLGERATLLFAHAISAGTDCLICSTFFRRILIDGGENPDDLQLSARDEGLVALGRTLATPPHEIPDELYERVTAGMSEQEIVALVAFGSIMLATNVFNNALAVPLDDYLLPYRAGGPARSARETHG
ncbi:MAG: hypothetical protein ABIZ91_05070 [Gemmatimonadaceae bacterium]